jgi:membrane peptidoglycan carboxypeptidase
MRYCTDPRLCRPVAGDLGYPIEVTGGSFPARIWSAYMSKATDGMEVLPFPSPVDIPDEVINAPPPAPAGTPEPQESEPADPEPKDTPEPQPTPEPSATPQPTPSAPPTIDPSPSPIPGDGRSEEEASGGEP